MKKILITGANSYIGTSFEKYIRENDPHQYEIDTLSLRGDMWKEKDFSKYDSILHVAGIAHSDRGKISPEKEQFYYAVNTDLTIEAAQKAKKDGVRQFLFLSSMIVYGDSAPIGRDKLITPDTPASPANCYGDSKLKAEEGLRLLQDDRFHVVILRLPMIYGKGSKGNYPILAKLAQKLPFFPRIDNRRSMLYIENLCEFLRLMIENDEQGTFFPQNAEYSNTSEMVKMIARTHGKKIVLVGGCTWILKVLSKFTGLVNKAFGSMRYEMGMSEYPEYRKYSLARSIEKTESEDNVRVGMENEILVSIITVCYNSGKTIRRAIESVLNQTYGRIEYIIVDGLSQDDTLQIAREYEERFRSKGYLFRIISERDRGLYDAMNKGIALAQGDLIGIINSDDWYETAAAETAVRTFLETPYDMFYADVRLMKKNGSVLIKHSKYDRFPTSRHWNHPTTFVTKKTYQELGCFRGEGIHDDFDFMLRVRKAGKRIEIRNVVLANFRVGGVSNDKTLSACRKRCRDRYRCYRNNGYGRWYLIECVLIEAAKYILN